MKIYKIGHSCFVIEERDSKILTDPGQFTSQNLEAKEMAKVTGLTAVLITHIHGDHINADSLRAVLENNPDAEVIGNQEVVDLLSEHDIEVHVVKNEEKFNAGGFSVQAFETDHAFIHNGIPVPRNTGYLFNGALYHPGDALFSPPADDIELLWVPLGAPWASVGELMDYALEVSPKKAMPSHDGMLKELGPFEYVSKKVMGGAGIEFIPLRPGDKVEI